MSDSLEEDAAELYYQDYPTSQIKFADEIPLVRDLYYTKARQQKRRTT